MVYIKERTCVQEAMLKSGIVVVMNKKHVKTPEDLITTMCEVYESGYTPVLGMSAPLKYVEEQQKPGDTETIRKSLAILKKN